jgi:hypothetical protein
MVEVKEEKKPKVTVCDSCFRACCWQGKLICESSKHAGTIELSVETLKELDLEHESYWDVDPNTGVRRRGEPIPEAKP